MTRKEQIREAARRHDYDDVVFGEIFAEGARWADAHPNWISVEDDLPPLNTEVLACFNGEDMNLCFWEKDSDIDTDKTQHNLTHWMPLPAPPKSSSSEFPNNLKGGEQ